MEQKKKKRKKKKKENKKKKKEKKKKKKEKEKQSGNTCRRGVESGSLEDAPLSPMENWKAVNPIRCPMRLGFRFLGLRYQMEKTKEPTAPRGGRGRERERGGGGGRGRGRGRGRGGGGWGQAISAFIQQKRPSQS